MWVSISKGLKHLNTVLGYDAAEYHPLGINQWTSVFEEQPLVLMVFETGYYQNLILT